MLLIVNVMNYVNERLFIVLTVRCRSVEVTVFQGTTVSSHKKTKLQNNNLQHTAYL